MSDNKEGDRECGDGRTSDDGASGDDRTDGDQVTREISLSLDATLEVLANFDRRVVLGYLMDASNDAATVDELVDHLVSRKAERMGERPGHDHVLTTLHHVHVPKLADAGVIEYDARSQEIRYWSDERLERWYGRICETEHD